MALPKTREKKGYTSTTEKGHGQVEKRECDQAEDIKWLAQRKGWGKREIPEGGKGLREPEHIENDRVDEARVVHEE